jgi:molybdopterin-guanine dinucleotide biosynthesis protein A
VRADQLQDPLRARFARIVDRHADVGPLAGIVAAQLEYPGVAWLVVACDLPFLDQITLEHLIRARQPERAATAYRSNWDGLPEPLCTIYEPKSAEAILALAQLSAGGHSAGHGHDQHKRHGQHKGKSKPCPRHFLGSADTLLLDLPHREALENVNTPAEYAAAASRFQARVETTADPARMAS